jgi:hypothetical protein
MLIAYFISLFPSAGIELRRRLKEYKKELCMLVNIVLVLLYKPIIKPIASYKFVSAKLRNL